ncbi:MFS transporter [Microcella sp.]|uniref:MFS transporter n=1 Tax=Microcella sp. TaxID=1913979 RepID=UPI00391CA1B3
MRNTPDHDGMQASTPPSAPASEAARWGRRVAAMAVIAATGVAVIYVPQPIQPLVADEFGVVGVAASAATIAVQAGYALGIVLLVSLGDRFSARRQVTVQLGITVAALVLAAASPSYAVFVALCFVAGATATIGQLLVAAALKLAPPARRARTAATLLGSFIVGLFVVRTALGGIAAALGWRGALVVIALVVIALVPVSLATSPREKPAAPPRYATILRTIPAVAAASPTLRLLTAVHALCFMAFIALWSMATLYAVDELGASVGLAALLGLAGLVGGVLTILGAPLHARVGAPRSLAVCVGAVVIGTGLIVAAPSILPLAAAGLLLVSAGMSSEQVSTQPLALASVDPAQNGRANTVFMAAAFFGGSAATAAAAPLYLVGGFRAVATLALIAALTAASLAVVAHRRGMLGSRPSRTVPGPRTAR